MVAMTLGAEVSSHEDRSSTGGEGSRVPKSLMNEEELQEVPKITGGVGLSSLTVSV